MALAHWQRTFTDTAGNVQPNISVTIRNESSGAIAAIFTDSAGTTPKDNPFTTDSFGYGDFYASDGRYRIQATGIDWRNEEVLTFENLQAAVDDAETFAQAAALNAGIYADTTEGLAATADGDYFSTPSPAGDEYLILYRNDSGSATEIDTYPNKSAVEDRVIGKSDVSVMVSDLTLAVGDRVSTSGYYTPGDGGGNDYEIVAGGTGTADGGSFIDLNNGLQAKGLFPLGLITINQFGAQDGSESTISAQNAINYAFSLGGREVIALDGEYTVSASSEPDTWPIFGGGTRSASDACLVVRPGVKLIGQSKANTWLKTTDETKTIIFLADATDSAIEDISLQGGYSGAGGAGAGIFNVVSSLDNNVKGLSLQNLYIENVGGYGIGLNDGHLLDCRIKDIETYFTGSDGIDVKSRSTDTAEFDTGNSIENFTARAFGQRVTGSVGVDIRGAWNINGVFAREFGITGVSPWSGMRLRPPSEVNNLAEFCNVSNVIIDCGGNADTFGVQMQSRRTNVSKVTVKDPAIGVQYSGSGVGDEAYDNTLSDVVVAGHSSDAFFCTTSARDLIISGFIAVAATGTPSRHFRIEGTGITWLSGYGDNSATSEFSVAGVSVDSFVRTSSNASIRDSLDIYQIIPGRVGFQARGPSTDIDVALTTKGTGKIRMGTHAAIGGETVTGYIEIKDSAGVTRKLAVVS